MHYEKNIPTEQDKEKEVTRVPCKNGNKRRPQSSSKKTTKGTLGFNCISFSLKSEMRIKQRSEFLELKQGGSKYYGKYICFQYTSPLISGSKIGLTVSKKYGNAVKRNLFKRRMKEMFRQINTVSQQGVKVNILPLRLASSASFDELKNDWINFYTHLNKV
tara:strand:- start:3131 stop:3613 length:483 start_codon:yes stop_codon:yes gene_type:complete